MFSAEWLGSQPDAASASPNLEQITLAFHTNKRPNSAMSGDVPGPPAIETDKISRFIQLHRDCASICRVLDSFSEV
jgi:hypothetical protein